jgi:hypothetical protein
VLYVTADKELKAGETYYDETNTKRVAEEDGTYAVSTGKVDEEKSASIFPNFYVVYEDENQVQSTKYYWLQDMIADGDTIGENGEFVINQVHENPNAKGDRGGAQHISAGDKDYENPITPIVNTGATENYGIHEDDESGSGDTSASGETSEQEYSYLSKFLDSINTDLSSLIEQGLSYDEMKEKMPYYVFAQPDDEAYVNGKKVTIVTVSFQTATEEAVLEAAYAIINKKSMNYADGLLKAYGKEVIKESVVWVDAEKVQDIEA